MLGTTVLNPQNTELARKRHIERHCAAVIRAVAGVPVAEFRHDSLFIGDSCVAVQTPYLTLDVTKDTLNRSRGVTDAMALRLAGCDIALHRSLVPEGIVAALVFDTLEQLRVESLAPNSLRGLQKNLAYAFDAWCRNCRQSGLTENEIGLLIYSITHIARSHLIGVRLNGEVECVIEATRFRLGPLVGHALKSLPTWRYDQKAYAQQALRIAHVVQEIAGVITNGGVNPTTTRLIRQLMLPRQDQDTESHLQASTDDPGSALPLKSWNTYHVFCNDYDHEVSGLNVVPLASRRRALREELDRLVKVQAVSVPRLALRLKYLFSGIEQAGWNFGEEDGYLDGRRLSQVVANPSYSRIFRQPQLSPKSETVVSFLIDNSGSMKRQNYEAVAILVDIYSRALDLAGIANEILGFTTAGWNGGRSIRDWYKRGRPEHPGRLNDRLHIVYKDAETSWRRARDGIATLLSTNHFREGLDGEALAWAAGRLRRCQTRRRCLVMISDGAPMDTATQQHNPAGFLDNHFREVIAQLENGGEIELRAIGNHLDLDMYFSRSLVLDFKGTLGNTEFKALEQLYGRHRLR